LGKNISAISDRAVSAESGFVQTRALENDSRRVALLNANNSGMPENAPNGTERTALISRRFISGVDWSP